MDIPFIISFFEPSSITYNNPGILFSFRQDASLEPVHAPAACYWCLSKHSLRLRYQGRHHGQLCRSRQHVSSSPYVNVSNGNSCPGNKLTDSSILEPHPRIQLKSSILISMEVSLTVTDNIDDATRRPKFTLVGPSRVLQQLRPSLLGSSLHGEHIFPVRHISC